MRDSDRPRARPVRQPRERDLSQRDDDDREPPARRRRSGNGPLILLVLLGGSVFAVLLIGAFVFFSYRAATRARDAEMQAIEAQQRALEVERSQEVQIDTKTVPGPPPPPAGPSVALPTVTLSNLRREKGLGGRDEVLVDYEFASGFPLISKDSLVVKGPTGELRVAVGGAQRTGTIRFRLTGPPLGSPIEVFLERKAGTGSRTSGSKVSNSLTLD